MALADFTGELGGTPVEFEFKTRQDFGIGSFTRERTLFKWRTVKAVWTKTHVGAAGIDSMEMLCGVDRWCDPGCDGPVSGLESERGVCGVCLHFAAARPYVYEIKRDDERGTLEVWFKKRLQPWLATYKSYAA